MKCAICGKPIDVPYYKKEGIDAYCPVCDIVVGMEYVKMIEDGTFKPVRVEDADFDPMKNYYKR